MNTTQQLELGFNGTQTRIFGRRRETSVTRAQWWFARMRAAVTGAVQWTGDGQPRPEQIWMPGSNRQLEV